MLQLSCMFGESKWNPCWVIVAAILQVWWVKMTTHVELLNTNYMNQNVTSIDLWANLTLALSSNSGIEFIQQE